MRVIFLDIDGVLNSVQSTMYNERIHGRGEAQAHALCPIACSNLAFILDKCPDVDIVISSTWRKIHDFDWLQAHLQKNGIDSDRIRGITPIIRHASGSYGKRGVEIDSFIKDWHSKGFDQITDFIILDDNDDMAPHLEKLIQTDSNVGLDWKDVERIAVRFKIEKLPIILF